MSRIYLNNDWYFNDNFSDEMLQPSYDFKKDECVRIPHTVKETPLHYFDEHEYQKIAAYFKVINVPEEWRDKDVFLTFDGVLHSCTVYTNPIHHYNGSHMILKTLNEKLDLLKKKCANITLSAKVLKKD